MMNQNFINPPPSPSVLGRQNNVNVTPTYPNIVQDLNQSSDQPPPVDNVTPIIGLTPQAPIKNNAQQSTPMANPQSDIIINSQPAININPQPVNNILETFASQINSVPSIQPLLNPTEVNDGKVKNPNITTTSLTQKLEPQSQQNSPHKAVITKVKLTDELNIFDWFRTTDIINQIAEKAKNSVDSVITVLDPGMREYLYSGGNINIIVISDSNNLISPIREAFQCVFGRATVSSAKNNSLEIATDHPVKLARGFDEAIIVAQERIKKLRLDTNNVPQNQVIIAVQPSLVSVVNKTAGSKVTNGLRLDENLLPRWFLTYCMVIEDPVLGATMNSYSQFIPIDSETIAIAEGVNFPEDFKDRHLGFAESIGNLMKTRLNLLPKDQSENQDNEWIENWSGLNLTQVIHELGISLAHLYRRKWSDCVR